MRTGFVALEIIVAVLTIIFLALGIYNQVKLAIKKREEKKNSHDKDPPD